MSNPLLFTLRQIGARRNALPRTAALAEREIAQQSATIFLVMRRMRTPLIVLIVVFSISVLGLALIPGVDAAGNRVRMTMFDAFYVISYTATTIGFGELPHPFTVAQRLWLTFSIYLSVIGWAYAIGSVLTLLGDAGFRRAMSLQRFTRRVSRLREPFLLLAGYGQTGRVLVKAFDVLNQRVVVLDKSDRRIEALDLEALHADVPGLVGDSANPRMLSLAGLSHKHCAGVLALTDSDEANLTIAITSALLRPDLPVFTRSSSTSVADRLSTFGTPTVINPFDVFGDHLRLALRSPATYQLLHWLEMGPGAEVPERGKLPPNGRWVICGYGRLGRRLTADLCEAGLDVTVIELAEPESTDGEKRPSDFIVGDAAERDVLLEARLESAIGLIAGTDNDVTNLSILATGRQLNSELFFAARQNKPTSAALFRAIKVDSLLVPTDVIAHQVYAQISTPLLWRFLREVPARSDDWATGVVDRLLENCGRELPALWTATLDEAEAPALADDLAAGRVTMGAFLRDPEDRTRRLDAFPLLLARGEEDILCPDDETTLEAGDELLFAGLAHAREELHLTMLNDSTAAYVLFDQRIPEGLLWRTLARKFAGD